MSLLQTLPLFLTIILSSNWLCTCSTTEFVFNTNFNSSNLLLFGDSTIQKSSSNNNNNDDNILSLTNDFTTFSTGRALFPSKIPTNTTRFSFFTSFIFSISSIRGFQPGHGFAFLFTPSTGLAGASSSQHLGLFNFTNNGDPNNHVFAVEFDVFKNQEFQDIDDNHVGLNVNSLTSSASEPAGYWVGGDDDEDEEFKAVELKNGVNYQVWIDYFDSRINVTVAPAGKTRPRRALISESLDLSDVFLDEMYVGFTGATGQLVESHRILAWSFSTTNSSIGDALVTQNLPSFVAASKRFSSGFVVGVSVGCVAVVCGLLVIMYVVLMRKKRKSKSEDEEIGEWEKEYWPHRIEYREIHKATTGFSEKNVIGFGGNGKVYKGVLVGGAEVAVKRILAKNEQGMREFLAEISSLGRLKHRNLVGLKGWCKREKGSLILVYDYMQNGSLDKRIFECSESMLLTWEERVKVLKDVASGILYLHEGWEVMVLHRDIKASNVLLDKDMNARLGDFGLARMHHHGQLANTTRVVGTVGYMAPEVVKTGRASVQADVFGFGVLVLEVVSGRRPIQEGLLGLVDWVRRLMQTGELVSALDERLKQRGGYDIEEVERVLYLGLACVSPQPNGRPTMGQVVKVLEGKSTSSDGAIEYEEEGMDVELLRRMRTAAMTSSSSDAQWNVGGGGVHPTFEDIRNSISSSMSLNGSDIIRVGR